MFEIFSLFLCSRFYFRKYSSISFSSSSLFFFFCARAMRIIHKTEHTPPANKAIEDISSEQSYMNFPTWLTPIVNGMIRAKATSDRHRTKSDYDCFESLIKVHIFFTF